VVSATCLRVGAHRGAHDAGAPENSLAAFERAVALGCDFVELDVRRTADGRLAVCHDTVVEGRRLDALTLAEAGRIAAGQGLEIPALEEALAVLAGRLVVDIEIKSAGFEREVLAAAAAGLPAGGYFITSFELPVLRAVAAADPKAPRGWIVGDRPSAWVQRRRVRWLLPSLRRRILQPPAFLILHHSLVDVALADQCRQLGLDMIPWTVNDPADMRRLASMQPWGLITDYPQLALDLRREMQSSAGSFPQSAE
jgi:glycerophosphoryl diester phosphodiesterase